jgi:hypothetical protein
MPASDATLNTDLSTGFAPVAHRYAHPTPSIVAAMPTKPISSEQAIDAVPTRIAVAEGPGRALV